jgi:hypothetical protein
MNEAHDHGITTPGAHGSPISIPGGPGQPPLHFTPEEWEQFRTSDRGGAKSVVTLMASIFSVGLVLYFIVAYVCWFKVM